MRHGCDWYKREPLAYLGGVQGMTANEHAVYSIVLELIYAHGGSVNNDPRWISGWISDMGPAVVRKTISMLVERGKLIVEGDQLTQKRAKNEAETKEKLRENRQKNGSKGGVASGKSRAAPNEINNIGEANGSPREEKRREEKKDPPLVPPRGGDAPGDLFPEERPKPEEPRERKRRREQFPEGWRPSEQLREFARGLGFDDRAIAWHAERCVNHHRGKGNVFADHAAAFRTWLQNEVHYRQRAGPAVNGSGPDPGPKVDRLVKRAMAQQQKEGRA